MKKKTVTATDNDLKVYAYEAAIVLLDACNDDKARALEILLDRIKERLPLDGSELIFYDLMVDVIKDDL